MHRRAFLGILATVPTIGFLPAARSAQSAPSPRKSAANPVDLILLGDSIFDNDAFVADGESVRDQLERAASDDDLDTNVMALAQAGARVSGVAREQLTKIEIAEGRRAFALVSVGGNDVARRAPKLTERYESAGATFLEFGGFADRFERDYRRLVDALREVTADVVLSTIPEPRPKSAVSRRALRSAVAIFNDRILRIASESDLPVLDLRVILADSDHFVDGVHPSAGGGRRIADTVQGFIRSIGTGAVRAELVAPRSRKG